MTRPKSPILLSSIIQYYLEDEHALKRPKKILIQQMKDIITLAQFMENKIPPMMKTIKQTIRDQNKSIRNFNESFKRNVQTITGNTKYQSQCYLEAAFDQMNHFTSNKEADKDYHERTLAEKQFKLKFLQSENLPHDFVWLKTIQVVRPNHNQSNQREHKDQLYYSSFNSKLNLIEVITRKYRILIGLQVQNNKYVWCINRIQLKLNRQVNLMLQTYFQLNVKPALKEKCPLRFEENMLACIQKFSFFLQLIDINRHICQLTSSQFFAKQIRYQHNGKVYMMSFTKAEDLRDALIKICQQEESMEPNFFLVLQFKKDKILARFHIKDYLVLHSYKQFTYQNPTTLFSHFETLMQCSKKYIKTINYLKRNVPDINKHVFIRLNGGFWMTQDNNWMRRQHYYILNEDGIYAGNDHKGYFTYVAFTQRYLTSSKVSTPFLNKLAKIVTKFEIVFFIIQIIQTILINNKNKQCQYDCCSIANDKINLFFRKKICAEETTIRNDYRQRNNQEDMTFNFLKFLTQFTPDFGQMLFYSFRDVDQKSQEHKDEWKSLFYPECNPQRKYIQIDRAIKAILYMQDNVIFKFVHEKKLRSESRSHFHIRF